MSRYYFHIDDGSPRDSDGFEIATLAEAKCEAVKMAGTIICDSASKFWDRQEWRMTVTGEEGLTLFTLAIVGTEAAKAA